MSRFMLGLGVRHDFVEYANANADDNTLSTVLFLELTRRTGKVNRHVQLLQKLVDTELFQYMKYEWVFCRLLFTEINEVIENIEFSKQLGEHDGLKDIESLLKTAFNLAETRESEISRQSNIERMFQHSCTKDNFEPKLESETDMRDYSMAINSIFF